VCEVARLFHTSPSRIRAWRQRYLTEGARGLADRQRPGRPGKLGPTALALLEEALASSPQEYGSLATVWTLHDLQGLLQQRLRLTVSAATIYRALMRHGYRYRRPRHDLGHRQDAEAVAATARVLDWLKKVAPATLVGFDWSTWTNVKSISTHGWRSCGSAAGSR
jgi:transposase